MHNNGEESIEALEFYIDRNAGYSFVVKDNGKIIGAIMCGHDGRRGLIHHLAVSSDYRRQGIGKKLLDMALEKLKAVGIKKCALFVLKENKTGEAFYKALGWKEEDIIKTYCKIL